MSGTECYRAVVEAAPSSNPPFAADDDDDASSGAKYATGKSRTPADVFSVGGRTSNDRGTEAERSAGEGQKQKRRPRVGGGSEGG